MTHFKSFVTVLAFLLSIASQGIELENYDAAEQAYRTVGTPINELPLSLHSKRDQTPLQYFKALQHNTIPSHFDQHSGRHTFIWASPELPVPTTSRALTQMQATESAARHYLQMFYPLGKPDAQPNVSAVAQDAVLQSLHNTGTGPIIARFRQTADGVEVFARSVNVLMKQDHKLVAVSGYFSNAKPVYATARGASAVAQLSAADAVAFAYRDMGVSATARELRQSRKAGPYIDFTVAVGDHAYRVEGKPRAKQVWYALEGRLLPAFYLEVSLQETKSAHDFNYAYVISALDGQVLFRKNLTEYENFTYRTFTDLDSQIPLRGPMGNIYPLVGLDPEQAQQQVSLEFDPSAHQLITLEHGPIRTRDPWLPMGATETHGNNVDAYVDISPGDGLTPGDFRANITASNTFDWAFDPEQPNSTASRKAAIVDLFYVNNWLHDFFYDHGFTEADGNAQMHNFGRGGLEGDELRAEGQDFSGRNNANMSTPADGAHPRMQMFNFSGFERRGDTFSVDVTQPAGLTLIAVQPASFGPRAFPVINGDVVRLEDETDPINDGCQPAVNAAELVGKIAIVDRGACNFTVKVKHAQEAGAIATLVANNRDGTVPAPMGGGDPSVIIPSFGLAQNDGSAIYAELDMGRPVSVDMFRHFVPDRDATLANGIIAHEWGHYITNRLVQDAAGLVNNQGRSMGEGWGDFLSIFMSIKASHRNLPGNERYQGLYSSGGWVDPSPYFGIRRVPYSTATNFNATSFKHIDDAVPFTFEHPIAFSGRNSEVHAAGEIWATMLLDAYVALLNDNTRLSFTDAQSRMADYLVAGLKMTPFAPTFVEARDGILAAAFARDRDDYQLLLGAFAKRGLGLGAVAPPRMDNNHFGVVESFATTLSSFELVSIELDLDHGGDICTADNVLDVEETGLLRIAIRNNGNQNLRDVKAVLSTTADIEFDNDGEILFERVGNFSGIHTASIAFTLESARFAEDVELQISFPQNEHDSAVVRPAEQTLALTVNFNFGTARRLADDNENTLTSRHDWVTVVDLAPEFLLRDAQQTFFLDGGRFDTTFGSGQMWGGTNNVFRSDISLLSPVVKVGSAGPFRFSFDHAHNFEAGNWDGGVIEINIGNSGWRDVMKAGGVFEGYAYNGLININGSQPLSGRPAFVNDNVDLNHSTVDFGTALNGQQVQLRFRIGTDSNTGAPGWIIDNMAFENIVNLPFSTVEPNPEDICDDLDDDDDDDDDSDDD